ncbi:hypothetical protein KJ656_08930, partial [bacterium]|nr:hypothetical protein [bacterium]
KKKNNILHGVKKILMQRRRDRKGTQSLPHVIRKDKNNMKVNKRTITRGLLENFLQKVLALLNITISPYERAFLRFLYYIGLITLYDSYSTGLVLNVSTASVWLHVCYAFNNSLRSLRLCVYKNIFSLALSCPG